MRSVSIQSKHILKIIDSDENTDLYGSNQDWYQKRRQRMCGCGPATVTNIIYYIQKKLIEKNHSLDLTREKCLKLMNEMWKYVTPGLRGIPSTALLGEGINKYLQANKLDIRLNYLDIPKDKQLRPGLNKVAEFLNTAFNNDTPVAFLNLDNGDVEELYAYHWVTAISLEYSLDDSIAYLNILDGGYEIKIDLYRWLTTTKSGGGFVGFIL